MTERRSFTILIIISKLILKLQKNYNLLGKKRNKKLLKKLLKLLKLLKRKLLSKNRLLSKLNKQINNEQLRNKPFIIK
jgi:hypothetical protein